MHTDFLVIGSGIAGLTFALDAARYGTVLMVTKDTAFESNSQYAQGGIAVVLGADDTPALHIEDTLVAGAGLCHRDTVEQLVREGPAAVQELLQRGVAFTMSSDHTFDLGREGGHSRNRVAHATDITGREIVHALLDSVRRQPRITLREYHTAVELILDASGACIGAQVLERPSGEIVPVFARATLLCTGGAGQVFLNTTNPAVATGDGIALAYRAGAVIANMEFMQFHPTMLAHPDARSFLISEAVRGFGAELVRRDGTPFMDAYHPLKSLAPRDIVARAIHNEMMKAGEPHVWLDLRSRPAEAIRARFPHIFAQCLMLGIDMSRDLIPVVPAAHYMCGGVQTDLEGRTTIPGLYACGETACTGAHGANRLASNSLLEGLVFAKHAAVVAGREITASPNGHSRIVATLAQPEPEGSFDAQMLVREKIRRVMWEECGIVRTNAGLERAEHTLRDLKKEVDIVTRGKRITTASCELHHVLLNAQLIVRSARLRLESRGTHFNADMPKSDDMHWRHDTCLRRSTDDIAEPTPVAAPKIV